MIQLAIQTATGVIAVLASHRYEVAQASTVISAGLALAGWSKYNRPNGRTDDRARGGSLRTRYAV